MSDCNRVICLVHFANIQTSVKKIHKEESEYTELVPSCVLTALTLHQKAEIDFKSDPELLIEKIAQPWKWRSAFWQDDNISKAALELLLENIPEPVIWCMGMYELEELTEIYNRGLLPNDVKPKPFPYNTASLILRCNKLEDIYLPAIQGYGHMDGARVAVFNKGEEPIELYDHWYDAARQGNNGILDDLLLSDDIMPNNAIAWSAPFGEENREHATIAKSGVDPQIIIEKLAKRLDLPVLTTNCTFEEFIAWDGVFTVPSDLHAQIAAIL